MTDQSHSNPDRFIRSKEIIQITGLSRTSIWRLEKAGMFPKRRQVSPGTIGWLLSEVNEWIQSR